MIRIGKKNKTKTKGIDPCAEVQQQYGHYCNRMNTGEYRLGNSKLMQYLGIVEELLLNAILFCKKFAN